MMKTWWCVLEESIHHRPHSYIMREGKEIWILGRVSVGLKL
jgi:hypothetical protein